VSADGSRVAFDSTSGSLVAGDTNQRNDVFVKNTRTGAVQRASPLSNGVPLGAGVSCLAISADGNSVVLQTEGGGGGFFLPPVEPAIYVKNLSTGALTLITPALATFPNTSAYVFQSISANGQHVALLAAPTTTYLGGYDVQAPGPARALVRDVPTGELMNLSAQVQLDLSQSMYDGRLQISPNGQQLAFHSGSNYPALGDTDGKPDVFVLNLANRAVTLVTTDTTAAQPNFGFRLISYVGRGTQLAFTGPAPSNTGDSAAFIKDLSSGATRLVFAATPGFVLPSLSLSDDGNFAAFDRPIYPPNAAAIDAVWLRDLRTGAERRINTTARGVLGNNRAQLARISADGSSVVFQSNATNLVAGVRGTYEVYIKTVGAGSAPAAQ
jgi:hypothetical protein